MNLPSDIFSLSLQGFFLPINPHPFSHSPSFWLFPSVPETEKGVRGPNGSHVLMVARIPRRDQGSPAMNQVRGGQLPSSEIRAVDRGPQAESLTGQVQLSRGAPR